MTEEIIEKLSDISLNNKKPVKIIEVKFTLSNEETISEEYGEANNKTPFGNDAA